MKTPIFLILIILFSTSTYSQKMAYQCSQCANIIYSETVPANGMMKNKCENGINYSTSHFWSKIDVRGKGYQCSSCGLKYYDGNVGAYFFGGCKGNRNQSHFWSEFKAMNDENNTGQKNEKETKTYNYVKPNWWNEPSNLPKWVANYPCLNDMAGVQKSDRDDKVKIITQDGEDILYYYKDGKFVYENKVKSIINGTWKCIAGKLYVKTNDGYEYTQENGWVKQGAKPLPKWVVNYSCLKDMGEVNNCDSEDKIKVITPDNEDNLYFYKDGRFVYENKIKETENGTWKCISGKLYINTNDGYEYTREGGWVKKISNIKSSGKQNNSNPIKIKQDDLNPNVDDDNEI